MCPKFKQSAITSKRYKIGCQLLLSLIRSRIWFFNWYQHHFWPKLSHPAAQSLCDSWATCYSLKEDTDTAILYVFCTEYLQHYQHHVLCEKNQKISSANMTSCHWEAQSTALSSYSTRADFKKSLFVILSLLYCNLFYNNKRKCPSLSKKRMLLLTKCMTTCHFQNGVIIGCARGMNGFYTY